MTGSFLFKETVLLFCCRVLYNIHYILKYISTEDFTVKVIIGK